MGEKRQMVLAVLVLGLSALAPVGQARDPLNRLKWHGFLSVGGGMTLDDDEVFLADPQSNAHYDDRASYRADSHFGMQATVDLEEGLSATAQLVGRGGDDFNVQLDWAYLNYELTDQWTVSAGRKRIPLYYYSDSLDFALAYHWIRPPLEVYSEALTSYEGASIRHIISLGAFDSALEVWGGKAEADAAPSVTQAYGQVDMTLYDLYGASWQVGYNEWLQARVVGASAVLTLESPTLGVLSEGNNIHFYGTSLAVDLERWFLVAELTHIHIEKRFDDRNSWYVSSGFRFGAFTPHLTYSELREYGGDATLQQRSVTAGIRYDFHPSAAVKLEFTTVQDQSDSGAAMFGDSDSIALAVDLAF